MNQIHKFYLTEFLKTQKFFMPVMILFLQFHKLTYTEIFILYAVQSFVVFLLEIPSGVLADQFGKKTALIISRASLIPAYAIFAFAETSRSFLAAMLFMAINRAFKSGTHKAYIFDYLNQHHLTTIPSEVYGKNKFWARLGEASASAAGGWIAAGLGFNAVFLFTLIPAALNLINTVTYEKIEAKHPSTFGFKSHFGHIRSSIQEIKNQPIVFRLILNSAIFVFCVEASEKFFQPYMIQARIPIEWFGLIYMAIMAVTALGSRYAYKLEGKFRRNQIANGAGFIGVIAFMILGLQFINMWGVFLFFIIFFLKSARRPAVITELNYHISSEKRATILSVDSLIRALLLFTFLPVVGYLSDTFSIYAVLLIIAGILVVNQILMPIPRVIKITDNNKIWHQTA